jgi:hypothetical protein
MTARTVCVLARCTGRVQCSRCFDSVAVTAGRWHAADADASHRAVCDGCTLRDDTAGHQQLTAWRRAAAGPTTGRRATA